jgi:SAM-dependent methyltransferase
MNNLRSRLKDLARRQLPSLQDYWLRAGSAGQKTPHMHCLQWLYRNELPSGGMRVHSRHSGAYPEVTGYLIPTLLDYGEYNLARRLLRWLLCVQRANGGFTSPEGEPHIFDTGQVLRGLIAGIAIEPRAREAAERCADYLCKQAVDGGAKGFGPRYDGSIPESVHLYVLPALLAAADLFGKSEYRETVQRCLEFYLRHEDALKPTTLTHFLGYELEALIDLGRADAASKMLGELKHKHAADGSVRAFEGCEWVCTPGLAQLAICWFKLGNHESAERAIAWLEKNQRPTGGFLGSHGSRATYFPREELSWVAKFYLDAKRLQILQKKKKSPIPAELSLGALRDLMKGASTVAHVSSHDDGSFAELRQSISNVNLTNVLLFDTAVNGNHKDRYDVAFSFDDAALHVNLPAALEAMAAMIKPGGWVAFVTPKAGESPIHIDEKWISPATGREIFRTLSTSCDNVASEPVNEGGSAMVMWRGQKRSRLSGSAWHKTLIGTETSENIVREVREGRLTEWAREIVLHTQPGQTVLEIGSGTGQISIQLAQAGRKVTVSDISRESLDFTKRCAQILQVSVEVLEADATQKLPLPDSAFDCTWNSGLLEHFTEPERRAMLREWARVTSGKLIILVPNASSLPYRAGKRTQEAEGTWPYGLEVPLVSLREDFEAAGLTVLNEYSVGAQHSLAFLSRKHPLRRALLRWMHGVPREFLDSCNQGYLLLTIGTKNPAR